MYWLRTKMESPPKAFSNWLNLEKILNPDDDPLRSIRINAINSGSLNDNKSVSTDATLQLNRKLNDKGRNVTFRGRFGLPIMTTTSIRSSDVLVTNQDGVSSQSIQ